MRPRPKGGASRISEPAGPGEDLPWRYSAGVGLVATAVYLALTPGVPGDKDAGELALVLALDGVPHPTGYPLYTLLGHWFVEGLHGLGTSWVYAANAWSSVGGGLAIGLLHALAARLVPRGRALSRRAVFLLALLPALLLLLNPVWTIETTFAEVYSWHQCWVLAAALAFVGVVRSLGKGPDPSRRLWPRALGWGFLCGLGGAHHATALLVALPLSLLLVARLAGARILTMAVLAATALGAALPFLSYARILRKAAHPGLAVWGHLEPGWRGLWEHATGGQYHFLLGAFAPSPAQAGYLAAYVYPFLVVALGALGFLVLRVRGSDRWVAWGLAGAAGFQTIYAFHYGASDPTSYFLPVLGLGLAAVAPLMSGWATLRGPVRRVAVLALALPVLALNLWWTEVGLSRRGGYLALEGLIRSMWDSIPVEQGFVCWTDDMFARLKIYQALDGEKRGLEVLNPWWFDAPRIRREFTARHGFDPMEGITLRPDMILPADPAHKGEGPRADLLLLRDAICQGINAKSPLPVLIFDPERRSLRLLTKPAPGDSARTG